MKKKSFAVFGAIAAVVFPFVCETAVFAQSASLPTGWSAADVGDVGIAGRTSLADSTWSVEGAGGDIWGEQDAFNFAYTPVDGDADIYVLVRSEQPTHQFAKAGLMIRQSLNPSSDNVLIDVKPDGGIEVLTRRVGSGTYPPRTTFVAGAAASFPVWLKLSRKGAFVTVFMATNTTCAPIGGFCTVWTTVASAVPFWGPARAVVGMAVTSHDTSAVNAATFDFLHTTQLSRPWSQLDLTQSRGIPGAWTSDGVFDVPAVGSDIWGASDEFQFVSQQGRGDSEIIARAVRLDRTSPFAKAGVMMRAGTGASAAHVILDVKPDGGIEFMTRRTEGGPTTFIAGGSMPFPAWLRLVRAGDQVDGYASVNGSDWSLVGTTTLSLPAPDYYAGLAVTSHDRNVINEAVFDNVSVIGFYPQYFGPNLLQKSGFEEYTGSALSDPWVSDRAAPWFVETAHPHAGAKNAACQSTASQDCGIRQEWTVPQRGAYMLTFFANADRPGALIGIDINGTSMPAGPVDVREPGNYTEYQWGLVLSAGDTLRVWMYSPANGARVMLDDVTLSAYSGPR